MNKLFTSSQAQTKTPKQSFLEILGGCAYSDAESALPPIIVVVAVEKLVNQLVNQVRKHVCADDRYECEQVVHRTHLLSVTRVDWR